MNSRRETTTHYKTTRTTWYFTTERNKKIGKKKKRKETSKKYTSRCCGGLFWVMEPNRTRLIGEYIVGPRIGSGSFAVVWRARHRQLGIEVAVKEIDKKLLSPKVSDNLLKEISILSTISHPNIIRFFEAIEVSPQITHLYFSSCLFLWCCLNLTIMYVL